MTYAADFEKALQVGRPPNVKALFPHSRALLVSGKVVDRAMRAKGKAIAMAANGRSYFVIRGALRAAQRANAPVIIEIAKSEGGQKAYCAVNYWNMARIVDALCNEMGITVPVAIHADHYGMKNEKDLAQAMVEIPTMFEAGITSIALADLIRLVDGKTINMPAAKEVFGVLCEKGGDPAAIVREKGLAQVSDSGAIDGFCDQAISAHPSVVADFRGGKQQALQFLVGQVMKLSRGKANPQMARDALIRKLS